jgi:hypothetical protein
MKYDFVEQNNKEKTVKSPAVNERFGATAAGSADLKSSAKIPPLRKAAIPLHASKFAQTLFEKVCIFRVIFFHLF